MAKFRILHTESSFGLGGQEYRIMAEATGMQRRGHQVIVAAPLNSRLIRLARQEGIDYESLPVGFNGWRRLLPVFLKIIARANIQVVHTHGSQDSWMASIAGRLSAKRPIIVRTRHKSTPILPSFRHDLLYRRLPHAVTTTGEAIRQQLICQNGLDPAMVFSIPTGVDLIRFQPCSRNSKLQKALGIENGRPIVGTVTFLRFEKGVEILIHAIRLLREEFPNVYCVIVGNGQEYQNLFRQIRDQHLEQSVALIGFRHDIPDLLSLFDVFALPSLEEGMPQSLTQALAMECPVVASAVGAVPEVVQDNQTGLLAIPGDPASLSEKIAQLLRNPDQGKRMGQTGRRIIEGGYSAEEMLNQTEALYSHVWGKSRLCAA